MKAISVRAAAEMAAEWVYHLFVDDFASPEKDAVDNASNIYSYISGGEKLDIKGFFGIDPEDID